MLCEIWDVTLWHCDSVTLWQISDLSSVVWYRRAGQVIVYWQMIQTETKILFFFRISTNRLRGRLFLFEDIFHLSSRFNLIQVFSNWKEKLEASLNSMWHCGKIIRSSPSLSVCINRRYGEIISQESSGLQTESRET